MRVSSLVCLVFFLSACTAQPSFPTLQPTQSVIPTPTPQFRYTVTAWVSDPEPGPDQNLILSGNLSKQGVILGGITMEGIWQQPGDEKPTLHCHSLVNYQRGRCNIATNEFPPDIYVPLMIHIHYAGTTFIAETGFTPRSK